MTIPYRDLALAEPWRRSLERSLRRRRITPQIRRSIARKRRASAALTTLLVAGPAGSAFAAAGSVGVGADLTQASPAARAIDPAPTTSLFKLGSRGEAVAEIQSQLGVPADGLFGPVTDGAVRDFQLRSGLEVDGVVGPATWTALFGLQDIAASAAGAGDGDVAVIIREREGSGDQPLPASDAPRANDISAIGGGDAIDAPAAAPAPQAAPDADTAPRTVPISAPTPARGACGSLLLGSPVKGTVTSGFGPRWGRNHDGIDIAAPTGTAIRAAECGVVSFSGVQSGYGNMVCVKHSSRFETCYAHMSRKAVSSGQQVRKGQVIGYVGCTGSCTGPHLHFETRVDGSARDPRPYLAGGSVPGAPTVRAAAAKAAQSKPRATTVVQSRETVQAAGGASAPVAARAPVPAASTAPAAPASAAPAAPVPSAPVQASPAPAPAVQLAPSDESVAPATTTQPAPATPAAPTQPVVPSQSVPSGETPPAPSAAAPPTAPAPTEQPPTPPVESALETHQAAPSDATETTEGAGQTEVEGQVPGGLGGG